MIQGGDFTAGDGSGGNILSILQVPFTFFECLLQRLSKTAYSFILSAHISEKNLSVLEHLVRFQASWNIRCNYLGYLIMCIP